jgi:hypothetical protein
MVSHQSLSSFTYCIKANLGLLVASLSIFISDDLIIAGTLGKKIESKKAKSLIAEFIALANRFVKSISK